MFSLRAVLALLLAVCLGFPPGAGAYSVLTHEVVVDLLWKDSIEPMLRTRFPGLTDEQLKEAHAYAYGGSIIQDMGYYPFGNKTFSDLTHYVRSGDFVTAMIRDASDANEYAFALGALAHYASDTEGHPAINRSVADALPKLRAKFGPSVTYNDDPKAHIRVEFGFDVAQVAKARFPSSAYHDFIGFKVSKPLLERAFQETYGLELGDVLRSADLAIGSYRRGVSKVIPAFTRAALATHKAELVREIPNFNKRKFIYALSRAQYQQEWDGNYERPGVGARILAFLTGLLPKVGPFKASAFKVPTPQTEDLYFKSVNQTVDRYRRELSDVRAKRLVLANLDFDTGKPTHPGEYELTDATYAKLVKKLADKNFENVTPELRNDLLAFFASAGTKPATGKHADDWQAALQSVQRLREFTATKAAGGDSR